MCGICGVWGDAPKRAILESMVSGLARRGPDGDGVWASPTSGVALGHTRLAIQDLSLAGAQPMASHCGRYQLILNGEIYNHWEIRSALGSDKVWRGHSDTETLVEAIASWGLERALQKANGMFALAVWDEQEGVLQLARDRIGEKPLYWGMKSGCFVFASELGPILTSGMGPFKLDHDAVAALVNLGYVPDPLSIVQEMRKLNPASILTVRRIGNQFSTEESTYWSLETCVERALVGREPRTEAEWLERIEADFTRAVKLRLISDVPLGAFLSGGVDSGLVVSMMAQLTDTPVQTFTIGVPRSDNESARAAAIATHLGTSHTNVDVSEQDCLEVIPQMPEVYSEPFGDSSQIPTWIVSKVARRKVTVALSGDGGDELFAGYRRHFQARRIWRYARHMPEPIGRILASGKLGSLLGHVFARDEGQALRIEKGVGLLGIRSVEALYTRLVSHWPNRSESFAVTLPAWIGAKSGLDPVEQLMLYDLATALPGDMLVKVDRAAMAHSLETRVPFLDHEFIESAMQVPMEFKARGNSGKLLLRKLMSKYAPPNWMETPDAQAKVGFGVPIGRWLRGELREWGEDLLSSERLSQHGLWDNDMIGTAWNGLQSTRQANHHALWPVLMFQAWFARYRQYLHV